jgi:hypothetical protein
MPATDERSAGLDGEAAAQVAADLHAAPGADDHRERPGPVVDCDERTMMSEPTKDYVDQGPPLTRRIVQIACANGGAENTDTVAALCNDGSVWLLVWGDRVGTERWVRLTDMPQD